jgi:flagellar motor switch protein FliG
MAPPKSIPVYEMSGPQRAAVILLALGAEYGKPIWGSLDEDEIRVVTHAMVQLGSIDADAVEELILEFVGNLSIAGAVNGSFDRTSQLLSQLLPPQQVAALMEEIKGSASSCPASAPTMRPGCSPSFRMTSRSTW